MLDFNDEELMVLETARKFVAKELAPRAGQCDLDHSFDAQSWASLGRLGLCGVTVSPDQGGSKLPFTLLSRLAEDLASGSAPMAATYLVHTTIAHLIDQFGSPAHKQAYLPGLVSGQTIGALAITEPGAGSDVMGMKCTAVKNGDDFVLNGQKVFITSGGLAGVYLVLAVTGQGEQGPAMSAFFVEPEMEGFSLGRHEQKMGQGASPTTELFFQDLKLPASQMLGQEGQGLPLVLEGLNRSRILVASTGVGLAKAAFKVALDYSRERKQFGRPIFGFQGLRWMLADMATLIEASRRLTDHAAQLVDADRPFLNEASMAKAFATDAAMKITTDCVQVLGGYGYMRDFPVERYMREAKLLQIVEGTNQIQREVIAKHFA